MDLHDTHLNVFLQDVEDAYKQVHAAVDDFKTKVDALKAKLALDVPGLEGLVQAFEAKQEAEDTTESDADNKKK